MELKLPGQDIQYLIQNAKVIAYENEAPALNDLSGGDGAVLDGVLTLLPVARAAIDEGKPLRMLDEPVFFAYASVTVDRTNSRDPARLLEELNRIIRELHKSGKLKELSIQYLGSDLTQEAAKFDLDKIDQKP
jgi:polar amino acid transport system substrate-binding protein